MRMQKKGFYIEGLVALIKGFYEFTRIMIFQR